MMKVQEFVDIAKRYANSRHTIYMLGGLLKPLTTELIDYKEKQWPKNKQWDAQLRSHIGYWASDCVCTLKSILWGATPENPNNMKYASNGVPDVGANAFFEYCTEKSKDFTNITLGEICWMDGHVGVYIGDGLCAECTPTPHGDYQSGVQINACNCKKDGYWTRNWTMHGKSPYIDYSAAPSPSEKFTVKVEFENEKDAKNAAEGLRLLGFDATI